MADFKDIIGQQDVKSHMQKAIQTGNISHAYIINGEAGYGRKMLADAFAKVLQCSDRKVINDTVDACDICKSCLQADSGNNPDIYHVTHDKTVISVDDIREQINNTIDIKPYMSKYKIYIIPDAIKMSDAAQNALLKTIEEPPEYAIIILISENISMLLPTIVSRCVTLNTNPLDKETISAYLTKNLQMEPSRADIAAGFCQGNMGKAIRFATSDVFIEMKSDVLRLLKNIDNMSLFDIMEVIHIFASNKGNIDDYLDLIMLWYRDVLMFKVTQDTNLLLYKDEYSAISSQASTRSYADVENIITGIDKAKLRLKANVNFDTAIELMILNIKDGCGCN